MATFYDQFQQDGVPAGSVITATQKLVDAVSGVVYGTKTLTKIFNPRTGNAIATAWRRRFRKYCHWLIHQADNYTASAGIFAVPGTGLVLSTAEATALAAVKTALFGLGYRYGTPTGPAPITPP